MRLTEDHSQEKRWRQSDDREGQKELLVVGPRESESEINRLIGAPRHELGIQLLEIQLTSLPINTILAASHETEVRKDDRPAYGTDHELDLARHAAFGGPECFDDRRQQQHPEDPIDENERLLCGEAKGVQARSRAGSQD